MAGLTLNLGCGLHAVAADHVVNVDRAKLPGVDVVWDLDDMPWPFDDETFVEVWASQIFEHVADPIAFMHQCWRVLEPGGLIVVVTPHYASPNAFTDPTHRRFATEHTFDYWIRGTPLFNAQRHVYAPAAFDDAEVALVNDNGDVHARLRKAPR